MNKKGPPISPTQTGCPGLVSVPCIDWMWTAAVSCLVGLQVPGGSTMSLGAGRSTICGKRNAAVEELLANDQYRWVMFLDSDMTFPPDVINRLLAHDADIVGGMYTFRGPPFSALAGHIAQRGTGTDPLRPTDTTDFHYAPFAPEMAGRGTIAADVLGTGCMLIQRRVFEQMPRPWFAANEVHNSGQNEDFNFCIRAAELGFSILCDLDIKLGHCGTTPIDAEFAKLWQASHQKEPATCR